MLREGKHEVTFKSRSEREEGANHEDPWGKGISARGYDEGKTSKLEHGWNVWETARSTVWLEQGGPAE